VGVGQAESLAHCCRPHYHGLCNKPTTMAASTTSYLRSCHAVHKQRMSMLCWPCTRFCAASALQLSYPSPSACWLCRGQCARAKSRAPRPPAHSLYPSCLLLPPLPPFQCRRSRAARPCCPAGPVAASGKGFLLPPLAQPSHSPPAPSGSLRLRWPARPPAPGSGGRARRPAPRPC